MGISTGALSIGMTALSTGLNAWSQYQQGQASGARYEYQAAQQERMAEQAGFRGELKEQRLREQGSQVKGAQRAAYAASGVQVDTGSPLDILAATDREIDLDASMIRYNTMLEANRYRSQAGLYRTAGSTAEMDSMLSAGSTLLTGGSRMLRQYDYFYGEGKKG